MSADLVYSSYIYLGPPAEAFYVHIRGHRSGTSVVVENDDAPAGVKVTYTVPATGYSIVATLRATVTGVISGPAILFTGHLGADSFVNKSRSFSRALGMAGDDTLDGRGNFFPHGVTVDELIGGDGHDALFGDPEDVLKQDV